ncbi:hypothetical protein BaRGS_00004129, partial [Batillaria attramentaria]
MVCKEDLCRWFKNLSPRKRIEYMCGLLHMCLPLELRFLGTVLENYGKKDYHYLRDGEIKANNPAEIVKHRDLPAECLRAKIMTSIALLHSANTACAQAIFDTIESNLDGAFGPSDDSKAMDHVLTILTLAANHPAFLFQQRKRLYEHLRRLDEQRRDKFRDNADDDDPPLDLYPEPQQQYHSEDTLHFPQAPLCNRHSPVPQAQSHKVCIQAIEVKSSRKSGDRPKDPEVYTIQTTWSNGQITEVEKKFKEVQEFHRQLIDLFPEDSPKAPNGKIPAFQVPNQQQHSNRVEHMSEQFRSLNTFFKLLSSVPSHILECDHMTQFFKGVVVRPAQPLPSFPPNVPYQPMPDDEESVNMMPGNVMKSIPVRNSQYLFYLNDANRIPRFASFPHPYFALAQQRFHPSHACPYLSPPHHVPQQQPSPSSPVSNPSSTNSSPNNSRSGSPAPQGAAPDTTASVTQLLKLLSLEKYAPVLGQYSVEQLTAMSTEEMSKLGLPREAQNTLHSKLDQINSEKPVLINGLIENPGYPSSSASPASPSTLAWMPLSPGGTALTYPYLYRPGMPASPRSIFSAADSSPSDVASPPPSPGPPQSLPCKLQAGDTSDGSEDTDRDKSEATSEAAKGNVYYSKSAQVKVSPGGGRGGAGSPHPAPNTARLTPPDDPTKAAMMQPQQAMHPAAMVQFYPHLHPHPHHIPAAQGLHGQYMDPKGDVALMGVAAGAHSLNSNTNNNFTTEQGPIMSTGIPMRQPLLQAGAVRPPFKAGQPQPAHTNMTGVLQGKNLITMPADPKPGSPIIPVYPIRPQDMQAQMAPGIVTSSAPTLDSGVAQRLPMYHLPLGRGQGGPITTPLPPGHQAQTVIPYPTLITRSVSTTLTGSGNAGMTVSSAHMVTTVTASHAPTPNTTTSQRSPSHNGNSGQRDSVSELGGNDPSLRSSPLQGNGGNVGSVGAAPSPPTLAHHAQCQMCQGYSGQVPVMYPPSYHQPYWLSQAPNGLLPQAAMSGFYAQGQPMLTNGFAPDVYSYNHPGYPTVTPTGQIHPMLYGNSVYQGVPAQQNAAAPAVSVGANGSGAPVQAPPVGAAAVSVSQGNTVTTKARKEGCYNCGSSSHKPSECQEKSMENMSGKKTLR